MAKSVDVSCFHSERKYKSLCCHYRFGIFKRKREKKIMVMLMLPTKIANA